MKEKTIKEKKLINPNECSGLRWFIAVLVGWGAAFLLCMPFNSYLNNRVDTLMGITYADWCSLLFFIPWFIGVAVALKLIAKTSLKDLILGVGGKINVKTCLILLGLYVLGFVGTFALISGNIHLRKVDAGQFIFLFVIMLLIAWIQTTFEELIFRGVFLRWACKNKIGYTKKAWIVAIVSALVFALFHANNPEVTSQSGWKILLAVLSYSIPGFIFFWADMHFGNLLPGIVLHWINNFLLYTMISDEVSVTTMPTLLVNTKPQDAVWAFVSNLLVHLPVVIYIIVDLIRKKKAAAK